MKNKCYFSKNCFFVLFLFCFKVKDYCDIFKVYLEYFVCFEYEIVVIFLMIKVK